MALPREGESSTFSSTTIGKETNRRLREITEKLCCILDKTGTSSTSSKDYELFIGCDALTGNPVIVSYGYDATGALTISYTNIDGTPASNNVVACTQGVDYELTDFQWFCDKVSQESVSRTDLYTNGVFTNHIWQDLNGNVIPTPIAGNLTVGACSYQYDSEIVCLVPNGSPVGTPPVSGLAVFDSSTPTPIPSYYIGTTDVTLTHTQVSCNNNTTVSQRLVTPTNINGQPLANQIRETRVYDSSGVLLSTVYTDPITNVVVTLPAGTANLPESVPLQKEPMFMCDNGTTFVRHFAYDYNVGIMFMINTDLNGAAYVPVGPVSAGVCTPTAITNTPGLQLIQSVGNSTQTSPFAADYVRISYDPPLGTINPITVQLPDITLGNGTFEVFPNNQESFSFATGILNSAVITGSVGNFVTVEFRHK